MISASLAGALVLAVVAHLGWMLLSSRRKAERTRARQAVSVASVLDGAADVSSGTAGVTTWAGSWNGRRVQVRTIIDTLATRKLPACWLSVSITEKVAVPCLFDLMMRPNAPTTFSNFDLLPHALAELPGFPAGSAVRTDRKNAHFPYETIAAHLGIFGDHRAKELLIGPDGVRVVWLLAEADRARYGVFRQADFSTVALDPALIDRLLAAASSLRDAINQQERQAA